MANLKSKIIARYGEELGEKIFAAIQEGIKNKESKAELKIRAIKVIEPSLPEEQIKKIADLVVSRQWITMGRHS
ncbi:MAG: hypothetical protein ACTSV5_07340 [Promethearchaeota archaeon]